uniref:Striatin N-terminal domain-containing protein n=1 Tax=Denticeps clupeoides TaxID=299321 RepID=A0AAY4CY60_9TELE
MEAERSGGVTGGANPTTGGSGAGRNPNGPRSLLGPAAAMSAASQPREPQDGEPGLSLPGILHFIQFEWGRFQAEKCRWEAEREELRAQVTFLQGERKGQENMKQDLVRRIKMLEYALKQERAKHQKLKSGNDQSPGEKKPETESDLGSVAVNYAACTTWTKYPEANVPPTNEPPPDPELPAGGESLLVRQIEEERVGGSVLDKIPFLRGCEDDDEDDSDEEDDFQGLPADCMDGPRKNKKSRSKIGEPLTPDLDPEDDDDDEDDSEDALGEFDFLGSGEEGEGAGEARISGDGRELGICTFRAQLWNPIESIYLKICIGQIIHEEHCIGKLVTGGVLKLEMMPQVLVLYLYLETISQIATDCPSDSVQLQDSREDLKKTWSPRFTLRSHFDAIRALTFHPSQAVLLTGSEDGTLKLWNLNKAMHSKKNAALDVEPIYTFRAHSGAVLSLAMGEEGESCYSGGLDGIVRCWKIPDLNVDPYDNYDPGIESSVLSGHEDSVWGLAYSASLRRLASCSADGTVRIWDPHNSAPCQSVFNKEKEHGTPTSVAFVNSDPSQVVVSFDGGETLLYDLNTEQSIMALESQTKDGSELINCVVSHPSTPVSITAHENRTIRFLDNKSGKVVHSMVAHLDAVTCLTTDPKGTYLISGSHDCSVRLWMLESRTCVQEITAHRKKHDEAIHDVAFHPSQPFIGSAGADALAKIFV